MFISTIFQKVLFERSGKGEKEQLGSRERHMSVACVSIYILMLTQTHKPIYHCSWNVRIKKIFKTVFFFYDNTQGELTLSNQGKSNGVRYLNINEKNGT